MPTHNTPTNDEILIQTLLMRYEDQLRTALATPLDTLEQKVEMAEMLGNQVKIDLEDAIIFQPEAREQEKPSLHQEATPLETHTTHSPQADALLQELKAGAAGIMRLTTTSVFLFVTLFICLFLLVASTDRAVEVTFFGNLLLYTGMAALVTAGGLSIRWSSCLKHWRSLINRLGNDVRVIGPIAQIWRMPDVPPQGKQVLLRRLTELLPQVRATDAPHFSTEQLQILCQLLSQPNWSLCLAVLKALEQVGDYRAVEAVTDLANSCPNPVVRRAAQDCLPYLRTRAMERERSSTLLRASSPTPAEMLLRPATRGPEEPPQQLLRPVE